MASKVSALELEAIREEVERKAEALEEERIRERKNLKMNMREEEVPREAIQQTFWTYWAKFWANFLDDILSWQYGL